MRLRQKRRRLCKANFRSISINSRQKIGEGLIDQAAIGRGKEAKFDSYLEGSLGILSIWKMANDWKTPEKHTPGSKQ